MKKKRIVKLLIQAGYKEGHGGNHDVFKKPGCPPIMVPRHNEIAKGTALKILKQAGIEA
ncbi:type II toxin-antitoxin system HicA family toxin [Desulfobacter latus]|uniref:Type II toxin-antitoxin system HicA family toxin n=1 Tax=Desulfobacter latus TaxID=2292 RepID=A0A850TD53_9BACT|nr:type II toxin-antitoxin system HicA family toxin [Desulfobacter latus]NWH05346.1 type II toxin-antitoxin system HicA family toxin [Desulfobacter latus]